MNDTHLCVATYRTHTQADEALSRLQFAGLGTSHLSFAGRDAWANAVGSYATGHQSKYRSGPLGLFWEKLWAILLGRGVFCYDKDGPMLIAGPLVRMIAAAHMSRLRRGIMGTVFRRGFPLWAFPKKALLNIRKR